MSGRVGSFNRYAAGSKVYGGGRTMPTIGKVDKLGYRERDARKAAINRRLKQQRGQR